MAKTFSFNNYSLQDQYIHTRDYDGEGRNGEKQIERLGGRDGGKFVEATFPPKTITLGGMLKGDDADDLEERMDEIKMQLLNLNDKNLDISYRSGIRRYIATCTNVDLQRQYYDVTKAEWRATFEIADPPFATDIDSSTIAYSPATEASGTFAKSPSFGGTYKPSPKIILTVNSETDLLQMGVRNIDTNQIIKVAPLGGFTAGDVLIIDLYAIEVTLNGVATDYEGVLPEFVQGDNDIRFSFIGTAWNVTPMFIYYPMYL